MKIKNIDWLFFDLGYTLVNEDAAHKLRIENTVESMKSLGIKVTYDDIYNGMISASKQYKSPFYSVMNHYGIERKEPYPKELEEPYSGSENLLKTLRDKYKIGIIANQSAGTEERLKKYGFSGYIDLCLSSAEIGVSKPDIRIFQMALEKCNCSPEKSVMIGDRLDNDIYPAKKMGMRTIWIKQGFGGVQMPISLEYEPDFSVNSLDELSKILCSC